MIATLLRLLFSMIFQFGIVTLRVAILLGAILGRLLIFVLTTILKWLGRNGGPSAPSASAAPSASKSQGASLPEFKPRPLHPGRRQR